MRLSKAQLPQVHIDLRLSPRAFGYRQAQWTGNCLARHLLHHYQLVYSVRQCRRLINAAAQTPASGFVASQPIAQLQDSSTSVQQYSRAWSGFSDTFRQEKALQRLRRLSASNLPLISFASSLFEIITSATNSGEAAQGLFVGTLTNPKWLFRDLETAQWLLSHPAEYDRANSDDPAISGMLISAGQLPGFADPVLSSAQFMSPRFHESPSYDEFWRHLSIYSGVMNILKTNGELIGFAPAWKSRREKPFTQSDLAFIRRAVPIISAGMDVSCALMLKLAPPDKTEPISARMGVITTDLQGRVVGIDETARALFCQPSLFDGNPMDAFSSSNLRQALHYVSSVVRQTFHDSRAEATVGLAIPATRLWWHGTGCVFRLKAVLNDRLSSSPLVTILVEEHEPLDVKRRRLGIRYGMSPRESEIFHLVKAGTPRRDIATQLDISPNTVKTYLKQATLKIAEMDEHYPTP